MRITRSPTAEADLIDIWNYVAANSPHAADRLLDEIERQMERLADYPEIGRRRPDITPSMRMLVVRRYLVLYRVEGKTIVVIRVVHGARDLTDLF